jgi:protein SCO1/2
MNPIARWILILGVVFAPGCTERNAAGRHTLPVYGDRDLTPAWGWAAWAAGHHHVGDFHLTDQSGRTVTGAQVAGRIRVVSFVFTSCTSLCPRIVRGLKPVQERFASDPRVVLVSNSVLPVSDTVERLNAFGREHGIDPDKWLLLTGDGAAINRMARESYFADQKPSRAADLVHTEHVFLVDGAGRIRGVYNGTSPPDVDRLIEDVQTLEREQG